MSSVDGTSGKPAVTLDLWLTLIAELDGSQRSRKRYETRAEFAAEVIEGFGIPIDQGDLLGPLYAEMPLGLTRLLREQILSCDGTEGLALANFRKKL